MLLEHEKMVDPWGVLRSTNIRELFDGERRGHQVGMVHGEGELLERAGKVQVERIVWSERWLRLGRLRLGLGHDAYDCIAYILELVLLGEGECKVASWDRDVVRILKKSSGQVPINGTNQFEGNTYCGYRMRRSASNCWTLTCSSLIGFSSVPPSSSPRVGNENIVVKSELSLVCKKRR